MTCTVAHDLPDWEALGTRFFVTGIAKIAQIAADPNAIRVTYFSIGDACIRLLRMVILGRARLAVNRIDTHKSQVSLYWLAPNLAWLATHEISVEEIAMAFNVSNGYVRRVKYWWSHQHPVREPLVDVVQQIDLSNADVELAFRKAGLDSSYEALITLLGIRREIYGADRQSWNKCEAVLDEIDGCFRVYKNGSEGDFQNGVHALLPFLQRLGRPSNSALVSAKAKVHRHIGWLHLHSGYDRAALRHSAKSLLLSRLAADGQDMDHSALVSGALIASHAALRLGKQALASQFLALAFRSVSLVSPLSKSDCHRQAGILAFCCCPEDSTHAREEFYIATDWLSEETRRHRRMLRSRHTYIIEENCGKAIGTLPQIAREYGRDSLRFTLNSLWACACALICGETKRAEQLLREEWERARRYPDLATLATLLKATPCLFRNADERGRKWIYHVLYSHGCGH